jgi:hypothetical protein
VTVGLLLTELIVAVLFVTAGVTKLFEPSASKAAIAGFGLPRKLASMVAIPTASTEVAVGVALLTPSIAWWGAAAALALLLVFASAVAVNLARGNAPDCFCLGRVYSRPASGKTLLSEVALAALAGFVVSAGPDRADAGVVGLARQLSAAQAQLVVGLVTAAALVILARGWLRSTATLRAELRRLSDRISGLEAMLGETARPVPSPDAVMATLPSVGSPAPPFTVVDLDGGVRTLATLRDGIRPLLLVFIDPDCAPCAALLPQIGGWQRDAADALTVAPVSRGLAAVNRGLATTHRLVLVVLQRDREVATAFGAYGTPTAVLIGADGTIGSHLAVGAVQIQALAERVVADYEAKQPQVLPGRASTPTLGTGVALPPVRLASSEGTLVDLRGLPGPRLVLFWSPDCTTCAELLNRLTDPQRGNGTVPLLVIVSGSGSGPLPEHRFSGIIVLRDPEFAVGRALGVAGIPSAVLVGAHGVIASPPAVGGPAVLALAAGIPQVDRHTPTAARGALPAPEPTTHARTAAPHKTAGGVRP